MQRLTFKNENGQEIEFSANSVYKWLDVDDLGGVTARGQSVSSPYQDGESPVGLSYFNAKTLTVKMVVISNNLKDAMRNLNAILNPKIGVGQLIYEDNGDIRVYNKVKTRILPKIPNATQKGDTFLYTSATFELYDPLYSDLEFTEQEVGTSTFYFSFDLNITDEYEFDTQNVNGVTVNNQGDVECPVEISIDGPVTAPLEIENSTTGEKMVIALDIEADTRLTITTELDNINVVKLDLNTGVTTSGFAYIDVAETTFFYLRKGENTLTITGNAADVETATIKFKNKYVGV